MVDLFRAAFSEAARLAQTISEDANCLAECTKLAQAIQIAFANGGKVLICGNGGSHADALHFAEEWTGRFRKDRDPFPVMALGEATHTTCVGNDFGFEEIFARQVSAFGKSGDVLLVLSTSGNSPNLLRAAEAGRDRGLQVIGLLGREGGELAPKCDLALIVPGETADRIQELHMLILHTVIEAVEARLEKA